jgi:hypothetical protein
MKMPYHVDYWRHGTRGTATVETLEAAVAFAAANEEDGRLSAERIVDAVGTVLLDGAALKDAVMAWIETDAQSSAGQQPDGSRMKKED